MALGLLLQRQIDPLRFGLSQRDALGAPPQPFEELGIVPRGASSGRSAASSSAGTTTLRMTASRNDERVIIY
jgi:hypothetical protein